MIERSCTQRPAPRRGRCARVDFYSFWLLGCSFGKAIGGGIFEFRLDQDAEQILRRQGKPAEAEGGSEKILLRVFCYAHGNRIVLLLAGYDKGERPSARHQQEQIELAKTRLKHWRSRKGA